MNTVAAELAEYRMKIRFESTETGWKVYSFFERGDETWFKDWALNNAAVPERSNGPDLRSGGENLRGSNPRCRIPSSRW
jgi:hypothetical protein